MIGATLTTVVPGFERVTYATETPSVYAAQEREDKGG